MKHLKINPVTHSLKAATKELYRRGYMYIFFHLNFFFNSECKSNSHGLSNFIKCLAQARERSHQSHSWAQKLTKHFTGKDPWATAGIADEVGLESDVQKTERRPVKLVQFGFVDLKYCRDVGVIVSRVVGDIPGSSAKEFILETLHALDVRWLS